MMLASEADEAWCPPTFTPSTLSRTWLAWWMVQLASHSTFFSSSRRIASSRDPGFVAVPLVMQTNLQRFAVGRNRRGPLAPCHAREGGHPVERPIKPRRTSHPLQRLLDRPLLRRVTAGRPLKNGGAI